MLESALGLRVVCGRITDPELIPFVNKNDVLSGQKYLAYLTALGIISRQFKDILPGKGDSSYKIPDNPFLKIIHKAREVYQEYF